VITVHVLQECSPTQLDAIGEIRSSAWGTAGFSGAPGEVIDAHDRHAVHWLAWNQGQILGAIRVCFHRSQSELPDQESIQHLVLPPSDQYCSIGRLVITPGKHGQGLGPRLAKEAVARAKLASPIGICAVTIPVMTRMAFQLGFAEVGRAKSHFVPAEHCSVMFLRVD